MSDENYSQIPPKSFETIQCLMRPDECNVKNAAFTEKVYSPFYERHLSHAKSHQNYQDSFDANTSNVKLKKVTDRTGNIDFQSKSCSSSLLVSCRLIGDVGNMAITDITESRKLTTSV